MARLGYGKMASRSLEACRNSSHHDFVIKTKEGNTMFLIQLRFNHNGCFVALEEYGGGGRLDSIIF